MGTEKLFKVQLIGLQADKPAVLDFLQENGIMHIAGPEEAETELPTDSPIKESEIISHALLELKWATENLKPFAKKHKPKLVFKDRVLSTIIDDVNKLKKAYFDQLSKTIQAMNANNEEIDENTRRVELLRKIPFDVDATVDLSHEGSQVFTLIAEAPMLEKNQPIIRCENVVDKKVVVIRTNGHSVVAGLAKDKEYVIQKLKEEGFTIIDVPQLIQSKGKDIIQAQRRITQLEKENNEHKKVLSRIAARFYPMSAQVRYELEIYHDRYQITSSLHKTQKTFLMKGYVSKRDYHVLEQMTDFLKVHIVATEVDEGPTKFKNFPYVKNFEFITRMFGVPQYGTIDPTLYISIFMPLFFGFMFSDVGYGILLLAASVLMIMKADANNKILFDAGVVIGVCSVTTIIFGMLFGSFFGNLIKIQPLLFDPFVNAKSVLIAALALGLLHLNLGIILSIAEKVKKGDIQGIVLDNVSLICLQLGGLALVVGNMLVPAVNVTGWILLGFALTLFIIKSSLMGIMEVTGFVGTWFSYARLLALGLATGGIALGINIMAEQLNKVSLLGPVLFVLLLLVGHLFNFMMNVLGSSIHSVRLHYIEFFSQFYSGGGKEFTPFSTKRVKDTL